MCRKITSHWQPLFSKKIKNGSKRLIFLQNWRRPHFPTKLAAVASFSYKIGGGGKDLATLLAAVLTWSGYWVKLEYLFPSLTGWTVERESGLISQNIWQHSLVWNFEWHESWIIYSLLLFYLYYLLFYLYYLLFYLFILFIILFIYFIYLFYLFILFIILFIILLILLIYYLFQYTYIYIDYTLTTDNS